MRHRLTLAAIVAALVLGNAPWVVPEATASSWSTWETRWYDAPAKECRKARQLADRFIGPIQLYRHGCQYPVRSRHKAATDLTAGNTWWVQLENTSPIWPAWGMRMEVLVDWNGVIARHDESTKWCDPWSFIVKVTQIECKVWNSGTPDMLVRMAYQAEFTVSGIGVSKQHGAAQHVFGTRGPGLVTKWP